ncbi:MAG: SIMPL domain-containing protein [Parcubacteria group bacterium]|nr:SIMPL domain-containing protein [Parcubacteria group bacterium]
MEKHFKTYFIVSVAIAVILIGFWYVKTYARSVPPLRTFSVQGEGKVVAIPDIALISFSVLTEGGKDLAALQKENTEKGNLIIAFLKENKVASKDIKTERYQITPRYQNYSCGGPLLGGGEPCPPSEIVGYSIFQEISVKVRDLSSAGTLVARVVAKGANTVSGPDFTVDEPETLQNEARAKAIANARAKAKILARAGGFRLGRPVSIYEGYATPFPTRYALESVKADGMGGDMAVSAPTFEPGSEDIRASVSVTYEIR